MNRWAANNPEAYERGERMEDAHYARHDLAEDEPCRVCGEYLTLGGVTCRRCALNLEEDRLERESGR